MHYAIVFSALAVLSLSTRVLAGPVKYTVCGTENEQKKYKFDIDEIILEPEEPRAGETVVLTIKGNTTVKVKGGEVSYLVELASFDLDEGQVDICSEVECPVKKGPVEISQAQDIPKAAPPGTYDFRLRGKDHKERTLFCVDIDLKIRVLDLKKEASNAAQTVLDVFGLGRKLMAAHQGNQ